MNGLTIMNCQFVIVYLTNRKKGCKQTNLADDMDNLLTNGLLIRFFTFLHPSCLPNGQLNKP